jgi:hypothetical protein
MSSNTAEIIRLSLGITLEKMTLSNYTDMLRSRINKGYMPSSTSECKFNTKPYYEEAHSIIQLSRGTGYYSWQDDYLGSELYFGKSWPLAIESNVIYFALDSTSNNVDYCILGKDNLIKDIQIITNLISPDVTFVRVKGTSNEWLDWTPWSDGKDTAIPMNPYELKEHLDIYT